MNTKRDLPVASRKCPVADALSTAFHEKKPGQQSNLGPRSSRQRVASCKGRTEHNTGLKIIPKHRLQWRMDKVAPFSALFWAKVSVQKSTYLFLPRVAYPIHLTAAY